VSCFKPLPLTFTCRLFAGLLVFFSFFPLAFAFGFTCNLASLSFFGLPLGFAFAFAYAFAFAFPLALAFTLAFTVGFGFSDFGVASTFGFEFPGFFAEASATTLSYRHLMKHRVSQS
jgi:hypothetical protein